MNRKLIASALVTIMLAVLSGCGVPSVYSDPRPQITYTMEGWSSAQPYEVAWHIDGGQGIMRDGKDQVASGTWRRDGWYYSGVKLQIRLTVTAPVKGADGYAKVIDGGIGHDSSQEMDKYLRLAIVNHTTWR